MQHRAGRRARVSELLGRDDGFSIVEMVVVMVIIAILISIGVPTILASRTSAQDQAAHLALRDVLLAEKIHYLQVGDFTADPAAIRAIEPNTVLHASDLEAGVVVTLHGASGDIVCMSRQSVSGTTFAIWESVVGGTYYGASSLLLCPATPPPWFATTGF